MCDNDDHDQTVKTAFRNRQNSEGEISTRRQIASVSSFLFCNAFLPISADVFQPSAAEKKVHKNEPADEPLPLAAPKRELFFKVIVVGDPGVGKTSFVHRFARSDGA